ncbi:ankyrin repeat protein, partial [Stipitochalara longipes BDJ]
ASNNGATSLLSLLVGKGEDISLQDRNGWTPLFVAARNQQDSVVLKLLELGAAIDTETETGSTALHQAVERGHISTIPEKGADLELFNLFGETALHLAASYGFLELIEILVKHGADLDARDGSNSTPLFKAAA